MEQLKRLPSKHYVTRLDLSSVAKRAAEFLSQNGMDMTNAVVKPISPYGMVEKNGKHYLVCEEGVGTNKAVEDKPFEINWYYHREIIDGEGAFSMYPVCRSRIDYDGLLEANAITGNEVRLDKFIRTFGDRLERNFKIWQNFLDGKSSVV